MAEISKFFNSAPDDPRTYQASDFAEYFGSVLSTGLLHTDEIPGMQVSAGSGLQTVVSPGKAIMEGYAYENTSYLTLEHSLPEVDLDRIDRVVLRLDKRNQSRFIRLFIIEGESAVSPTVPELQRDEFVYELSLAQVYINANTSSLNSDNVTDERLDENLCGLVNSLITLPTSVFEEQWGDWFNGTQVDWLSWFNSIQEQSPVSQLEFNNLVSRIGQNEDLTTEEKSSIIAALNEERQNRINHTNANNPHDITPSKIGAETPSGAQAKANQAETNAKNYAMNKIVGYGGGSNPIDPNKTDQSMILTNHDNTPGGYYYILTFFYATNKAQIAIKYASGTPDMYIRYLYNSAWSPWENIQNSKQTLLWSGANLMAAEASVVRPSKPLRNCKNGWILIWSDYDPGGPVNDFHFTFSHVPKGLVENFTIDGTSLFTMSRQQTASNVYITGKELVIVNDEIRGQSVNGSSTTQSDDVILRAVLEY